MRATAELPDTDEARRRLTQPLGGVLYFFAEDGSATVVQPGREYKEIGRNKLDGGTECKSTPAVAGKSFFIRTDSNLYRIEQKQ